MNKCIIRIIVALLLFCVICALAGCGGESSCVTTAEKSSESEEIVFSPITVDNERPEEPVDTEPPFFHYFVPVVTLYRGVEFDLHRYISYIDDYDPDVELTVEGEADVTALGEYALSLTLTDDAGNSSTSEMTVRVIEYTPPDPDQKKGPVTPEEPQSFAEFTEKYKREGTSVGIDVSRWQGEIDFKKVANEGCEFVIMRIGGYDDGVFEDMRFAENIKGAKAAGLKIGVYWYSEERGPDMVREDAEYMYSLLDGEELDFPIFFDWEDFLNFEDYKMSLHDLVGMFAAFREEAEARGYKAALYSSKNFLNKLWPDESKDGGVWLAHYIDETNYEGDYFLWQQGIGRIDGIDADVDVDVLYPGRMP